MIIVTSSFRRLRRIMLITRRSIWHSKFLHEFEVVRVLIEVEATCQLGSKRESRYVVVRSECNLTPIKFPLPIRKCSNSTQTVEEDTATPKRAQIDQCGEVLNMIEGQALY